MTPGGWIEFVVGLFVVLAAGCNLGYKSAEALRYKRWHLSLHAVQERLEAGELEPFTADAVFACVTEYQRLPAKMLVGMKLPCQEDK